MLSDVRNQSKCIDRTEEQPPFCGNLGGTAGCAELQSLFTGCGSTCSTSVKQFYGFLYHGCTCNIGGVEIDWANTQSAPGLMISAVALVMLVCFSL